MIPKEFLAACAIAVAVSQIPKQAWTDDYAMLREGIGSQYAPGKMERTIAVRQLGRTAHDLPRYLPPVDGYAAVKEPHLIGRLFWARPVPPDGERPQRWELFLAVDCSSKADGSYWWMDRNNILAEFDYNTAVRWGVAGPPYRGVKVETIWIGGE